MKFVPVFLLILLFQVPAAAAWHLSPLPNPQPGQDVDVRDRVVVTNTANLDNAGAGNLMTFQFSWDPEFSYETVGHTLRVGIFYTAAWASSSNGAWNISVAKELTGNITACSVRIETVDPTGLTLDALLVYATFHWECIFTQSTNPHFHYHTVYVNRTVMSGTPAAITAETIAVKIESEDIVIVSMATAFESLTDQSALEFIAFVGLVLIAIVIWSRTTDYLVQMAMGVLPFIPAIIWMYLGIVSGWPGNAALAIFAGSVGGYLMIRASYDKAAGKGST